MVVNGSATNPAQGNFSLNETPLEYMKKINKEEMLAKAGLPDDLKKNLILKLNCTLVNPKVTAETALRVLKDCTGLQVTFNVFFPDDKFASPKYTVKTATSAKEKTMGFYKNELLLIHNLCVHYALIYYQGDIPEGILDVFPEVKSGVLPEGVLDNNILPRLVHLKTPCGSNFLCIPRVEPVDAMLHSYVRKLSICTDGAIRHVDLVYSGNIANHSSGFYYDLDNSEGYSLAFGAYVGKPGYQMGGSHIVYSNLDNMQEFSRYLSEQKNQLIVFAMSALAEKIGGLNQLQKIRKVGEMVFLPFPLTSQEQEEASYAEDFFQAQDALHEIKLMTNLLGMIPDQVADMNQQKENDEKRAKVLERKRSAEKRLADLSREYEAKPETLIATIEGKLLALHEAEYQQAIADEQAKISAQIVDRSQPGIMGGKKLSRREKEKAKEDNEAEKKRLEGELVSVKQKVREAFLAKIKGRHHDSRHVLKSFHEHLTKNNIKFNETQDGSHRVTHTEGAKALSVVEEHKGSVPFAHYSGKVIRQMLKVFGDAKQHQTLAAAAV